MDGDTWINLGLVVLFVVIGGIFAATEMAIVTLRESQINRLAKQGGRGARAAVLARDPNTFLAAVQIGVTVAGFFSAAYGASALAPNVAAVLQRIGIPDPPAEAAAVIGMTLTSLTSRWSSVNLSPSGWRCSIRFRSRHSWRRHLPGSRG